MGNVDTSIDGLYIAWGDAFHRRDVDAILDLLTPDYVLWAPGRPPVDSATLRPMLEAALATYDIRPSFEREERIVSEDLAFECGWDVQTLQPRLGGDVQSQRQRVFLLLRRGQDGRWRFARGITQGSAPPDEELR